MAPRSGDRRRTAGEPHHGHGGWNSIGDLGTATELPVRFAEISALGRDALLDANHDATQVELCFAPGTSVRRRLEAIIAAEAECCAFLTMRLADRPDVLVLTVSAPEGAETVLAQLVAAVRGRRPPVSSDTPERQ